QPGAPRGHAGGQQRGLGELGPVEALVAVLRQRPQVDARAFGGFGEGAADQRMRVGQRGKHAVGLRPLAGKHEGKRSGHGAWLLQGTRMILTTLPDRLYPSVLWERRKPR